MHLSDGLDLRLAEGVRLSMPFKREKPECVMNIFKSPVKLCTDLEKPLKPFFHLIHFARCKCFNLSDLLHRDFALGSSVRTGAMALVDSEAAFASHCNSIDKSRELLNIFTAANLTSFMRLAFAIGTPQTPASEESFREFATEINGGIEPSITTLSLMRRLHFEAVTMVVAHLKTNVTTDSAAEGGRKLPPVEKVARLNDQQARLRGLSIRGELQPCYALIDMVAGIFDSGSIVWIPPSKCTKRDSEVQQSLKEKPTTLTVEQQTLRLSAGEPKIKADTSNELLMQWALQRRGLAFDQCKLISNDVHEKWVQSLLMQLTRDAPPGYNKVNMEQILRADKELFTVMAQEHSGPFANGPKGELPLDLLMGQLAHDPRISMHLLPLPSASKMPAQASVDDGGKKLSPGPPRPINPKKKAKPSAKAKAGCPDELKGYHQFDDTGNPICWSYNMSKGCQEETKDGRCKKGMHICIKCKRNNHSLVTCRVKKS